jgi:hypothetical protein
MQQQYIKWCPTLMNAYAVLLYPTICGDATRQSHVNLPVPKNGDLAFCKPKRRRHRNDMHFSATVLLVHRQCVCALLKLPGSRNTKIAMFNLRPFPCLCVLRAQPPPQQAERTKMQSPGNLKFIRAVTDPCVGKSSGQGLLFQVGRRQES